MPRNRRYPLAKDRQHTTVTRTPSELREQVRLDGPAQEHWRPKTRAECKDLPRPCPYYGCKHHLGLDVLKDGSLRLSFGEDVEALRDMQHTCVLDVAENPDLTLDDVANISNITRERVRQLEVQALAQIRKKMPPPED